MSVNLSPIGNGFQFFTTTGLPLAGGLIYTYQAGSTTSLATYSDNGGVYANTNPIVLGTDGRPQTEIWLTYGYNYKFVLQDSNYNTIQTYDNLYGIVGTQPSSGATIPSGLIAIWSGAIGAIPSGWYLCNGQNGTPDLRDSFVIGAGNSYAVGATGGSKDAIVVSHTHTATSSSTVTDPGHAHSGTGGQFVENGGGGLSIGGGAGYSIYSNTATASTGITVATSTTNTTAGVSGTNANLPPYYALAFIQKA